MKLTSWLNHTVKTGIFCLAANAAFSQTTTLKFEEAQGLARANYPIIKQKELISQTAALNISNISKGYLPQLNINGQATYQSDVTSVNVPIPNIKIDAPEKDQYKIYAEASQLIYDGGQ
ncbi:MAG TPA: TolC family protein, partial [Ferruginibacter sp.]|nr:TolC family protein [Ferruginibacter sp.]